MRRFTLPRTLVLTLTCALAMAASGRLLLADDAPPADPKAPAAAADAPAEPDANPVPTPPASELFEGVKLIKVDSEGKSVTVLIPPDPAKAGRAYRRLKLSVDDNSLIMLGQQPSNMAALQEGMIVDISHLKKGKTDTVDTIVIKPQADAP